MTIIWYIYRYIYMHCTHVTGHSHDLCFFDEPMNQSVVGKVRACLRKVTFHWGLTRLWSPWSQRFPSDLVRCLQLFPSFLTCNHWSGMFWSSKNCGVRIRPVLKFRRFNVFITMNPGYASTLAASVAFGRRHRRRHRRRMVTGDQGR